MTSELFLRSGFLTAFARHTSLTYRVTILTGKKCRQPKLPGLLAIIIMRMRESRKWDIHVAPGVAETGNPNREH